MLQSCKKLMAKKISSDSLRFEALARKFWDYAQKILESLIDYEAF